MKAAKRVAKSGGDTEWVSKVKKKFGKPQCTVCGERFDKMTRGTLIAHFNDDSPDRCPTTDD